MKYEEYEVHFKLTASNLQQKLLEFCDLQEQDEFVIAAACWAAYLNTLKGVESMGKDTLGLIWESMSRDWEELGVDK